MVRKNKFKLLKLLFILSAALAVFLSTASGGHAKPFPDEQVNLTVPSYIEAKQTSDGNLIISDFSVENKTPVDFKIENINAISFNDWYLESKKENLKFNSKSILMNIEDHQLKLGKNDVDILINYNSSKNLKIDMGMHCFEHAIDEKAFELIMDYKVVPRKFSISFYNPKGGSIRPISGFCGETVQLPNLDEPNFIGWTDFYSNEFYGDSMVIPIGGTRVIASYKQTILDVNKFKSLPFLGGENSTLPKTITGLTIKYGHPSNLDFEYWDISKQGNNSIICYRENQDPNSEKYNDIIVAADEREFEIEGDVSKIFLNTKGIKTPLKFFRADTANFKMSYGNINYLFEGCEELTDISGLSNLITKNLTSIEGAFKDCKNLMDMSTLSYFSTAKLQDVQYAFSGCNIQDTTFLENWNVSMVVDFREMFSNCENLKMIDLSNWNISNTANIENMFLNAQLEFGYAKTQEISDRLNSSGGLFAGCFRIKS